MVSGQMLILERTMSIQEEEHQMKETTAPKLVGQL